MGSGMLPAGAYVTLEHEYILIVRKGTKREFISDAEKKKRQESAIFWEERNSWFSDVWFDIKGTTQKLTDKETRQRSAAFPFELAYRLINMYSAKNDTVLDPFLGTGTTIVAAISSGRNSIGYEMDRSMKTPILLAIERSVDFANNYIHNRLKNHISFIKSRLETQKPIKHTNKWYNFPVITRQEKKLLLNNLKSLKKIRPDTIEISYDKKAQTGILLSSQKTGLSSEVNEIEKHSQPVEKEMIKNDGGKGTQLSLFHTEPV